MIKQKQEILKELSMYSTPIMFNSSSFYKVQTVQGSVYETRNNDLCHKSSLMYVEPSIKMLQQLSNSYHLWLPRHRSSYIVRFLEHYTSYVVFISEVVLLFRRLDNIVNHNKIPTSKNYDTDYRTCLVNILWEGLSFTFFTLCRNLRHGLPLTPFLYKTQQ